MSRLDWVRVAIPLALGALAMVLLNAAAIAYVYGVGFGAIAALLVEHRLDHRG